jgi:hypothetical protein
MAWSWGHSPEAYAQAYLNLEKFDLKELRVIWAEWKGCEDRDGVAPDLVMQKYNRALKDCIRFDFHKDTLQDEIWGFMSEQATCENGGFEAWGCPFGCGCHLVSFSD